MVLNHAYVETLSSYNEVTIDNVNMKFVIVVYGSVIDTKTEIPYLAPCILPKTCEQVRKSIYRVIFCSWCPISDFKTQLTTLKRNLTYGVPIVAQQ